MRKNSGRYSGDAPPGPPQGRTQPATPPCPGPVNKNFGGDLLHNRRIIEQAMRDPDRVVVAMCYTATDGTVSKRYVSPVKWDRDGFVALCLTRQEPRRFRLANCDQIRLVDASSVLMGEAPASSG